MNQAWWETQWLLSAAASTIAGVGALLLLWSMFRDRSRGRARCPRCWYDLAGLVKPEASAPWPVTCPECGRKIEREAQTRRTRRHWKAALLAIVLMLAAYPIGHIADAREYGPQRLLPLWLQAVAWPVGEVRRWPASEARYDRAPIFDLSEVLDDVRLGRSPTWPTPRHDIITRLGVESPEGWVQRVFASRVSLALSDARAGSGAKCFDLSHLWKPMRGEAPWLSPEQVRGAWEVSRKTMADVQRATPYAGPDYSLTKASWIAREIEAMEYLLLSAPLLTGDGSELTSAPIGSCVVVAGPRNLLARLDELYDALSEVIEEGPGARRSMDGERGQLVVLRNISDLKEFVEIGRSDVDRLLAPTRVDLNGDTSRWSTYIEGNVCCSGLVLMVTEPEVRQRIVDERLAQLRAERAAETRHAPDK